MRKRKGLTPNADACHVRGLCLTARPERAATSSRA